MLFTNKTFEERMKIRNLYCVLLIVLGVASIVVSMIGVTLPENQDFSLGFYSGLGFALIVSAIITLIKNKRMMNDPEKRKAREIYEKDERNRMIGLKTWSYAGYTMFVLLYVAMLVAGMINTVVMQTILIIIAVYALCILIFTKLLQKNM